MKAICLDILHPDPRSANLMSAEFRDKLKANYKIHKRFPALIVRQHPSKRSEYAVIDGHQRLLVAKELGLKELPCEVWDVDDKRAALLLATLNQLRGEDIPQKRAKLFEGLLGAFSKEQLVTLVPESQQEIDALIGLLKRNEETLQAQFKEALKKEAQLLPVLLNFVLSPSDAELVTNTLKARQPEDLNKALVQLCQEVNVHE